MVMRSRHAHVCGYTAVPTVRAFVCVCAGVCVCVCMRVRPFPISGEVVINASGMAALEVEHNEARSNRNDSSRRAIQYETPRCIKHRKPQLALTPEDGICAHIRSDI